MNSGLWAKLKERSQELTEKFKAWGLGDSYARYEADINQEKWWERQASEAQVDVSAPLVRRHAIVAGLVQHVGFRWSAGYQASRLGLTGWIKNLPTSEVEVEFQGTPANVAAMTNWLHHGPRGASVTKVLLDTIDIIEGEKQFRMEY